MRTKTLALSILILSAVLLVPSFANAKSPMPSKTLDNLQAAYNGESNARARYLAFAQKADQEGFHGAASLFRAAAKAEDIHAANHAKVIRKMGAEPVAEIKPADVKTTKENLAAAVEGETYERDTMYPSFIKQAQLEKKADALRSFNYAKTAEAEHATLYAQNLETLAPNQPVQTLYVCTVCGYTTKSIDFLKCPSCFNSKEKYVKVA